jgi:lysophospholipase L1-like esterase
MTRRLAFYALSACLWLVVLLVALELGARYFHQANMVRAEAYGADLRKSAEQWELLYMAGTQEQAPEPPPTLSPNPNAPNYFAFPWESPAQDRLRFAQATDQLVIVCGGDGRILEVYPPSHPPELALAGQGLHPGEPIETLVEGAGEEVRRDFVNTFDPASNPPSRLRDYPLPLPGNSAYHAQIMFNSPPGTANPADSVLVSVRASIFEELWVRYRPHVWRSASFGHWTVWTNNAGFRDSELTMPKPRDEFRILCIGGSTTFEGPRCDLTYPNLLERKLRDHFGVENIEVINGGVYGITSEGESGRMQEFLALEPDFLIHYNFANDVPRVEAAAFHQAGEMGTLSTRAGLGLRGFRLFAAVFSGRYLPPAQYFAEAIETTTMPHLRAMATMAREHGIPIAFCSFARPSVELLPPLARHVFEAKYDDKLGRDISACARATDAYGVLLRAWCAEEGLLYIPVAEGIPGGPEIYIDHCHMYLNGIEQKAETIFQHVRDPIAALLGARKEQPHHG